MYTRNFVKSAQGLKGWSIYKAVSIQTIVSTKEKQSMVGQYPLWVYLLLPDVTTCDKMFQTQY